MEYKSRSRRLMGYESRSRRLMVFKSRSRRLMLRIEGRIKEIGKDRRQYQGESKGYKARSRR